MITKHFSMPIVEQTGTRNNTITRKANIAFWSSTTRAIQ